MRLCPNCGREVYDDSIRCMHCKQELVKIRNVCDLCSKADVATVVILDKLYCAECAVKVIDKVIVTTTNSIEGRKTKKYIGIESAEVVIGTGLWSELTSDVSDFFGKRSTEFENKLARAKVITIQKMKLIASQRGANAILAMDLDYTEFSGNRIGVIATGTLVEID